SCEACSNTAKPVLALAFSELAFYCVSFSGIQFGNLPFFACRTVFRLASQCRSTEPNPMLFAEAPVFARAVDLVRLDDSRIESHAAAILLDHVNERRALVEVIPR